jgi:death-on-curing protein
MAARTGYYATVAELAAVYLFGLAKNHPFIDGNKRVAHVAAFAFLAVNGVPVPSLDVAPWVAVVEGVAAGTVERAELVAHVTAAMGGDPITLDPEP